MSDLDRSSALSSIHKPVLLFGKFPAGPTLTFFCDIESRLKSKFHRVQRLRPQDIPTSIRPASSDQLIRAEWAYEIQLTDAVINACRIHDSQPSFFSPWHPAWRLVKDKVDACFRDDDGCINHDFIGMDWALWWMESKTVTPGIDFSWKLPRYVACRVASWDVFFQSDDVCLKVDGKPTSYISWFPMMLPDLYPISEQYELTRDTLTPEQALFVLAVQRWNSDISGPWIFPVPDREKQHLGNGAMDICLHQSKDAVMEAWDACIECVDMEPSIYQECLDIYGVKHPQRDPSAPWGKIWGFETQQDVFWAYLPQNLDKMIQFVLDTRMRDAYSYTNSLFLPIERFLNAASDKPKARLVQRTVQLIRDIGKSLLNRRSPQTAGQTPGLHEEKENEPSTGTGTIHTQAPTDVAAILGKLKALVTQEPVTKHYLETTLQETLAETVPNGMGKTAHFAIELLKLSHHLQQDQAVPRQVLSCFHAIAKDAVEAMFTENA